MDGLWRTDLCRAAKKLAKLQSDHGEITEAEGIESTRRRADSFAEVVVGACQRRLILRHETFQQHVAFPTNTSSIPHANQ